MRRGLHTSVLEQQDRLLPQLLDEDMAALLLRDTKNPLLDIYLEERAGAFTVENGKVSGVQTDKRVIPAQLVIVAVGVRPNVELAREAGLVIGPSGCIAVNEYLQTSDDAIMPEVTVRKILIVSAEPRCLCLWGLQPTSMAA